MATDISHCFTQHPSLWRRDSSPSVQSKDGLPPVLCEKTELPDYLRPVCHTHLKMCDKEPLTPQQPLGGTVTVKVIVGNSGKSRELELLRSDTVGRLLEKLRAELPDLGPDVSLALQGKPVRPEQCLGQLGNCSKLQFIIFHRCHGG